MAEKKNIVIKLKFPKGHLPEKPVSVSSAPKTITEWNYKRIALALGGIALLAALAFYFYSAHQAAPAANTPKVTTAPESSPIAVAKISADTHLQTEDTDTDGLKKKVRRIQLTSKIVDSEPVGDISLPLRTGEKTPVPVYFFAEIADMKGKTIYHEWWLDEKLISKKTVNISDKMWRTSSRQMIAYTTNSNWSVRLVDDSGRVLAEKNFTATLKK